MYISEYVYSWKFLDQNLCSLSSNTKLPTNVARTGNLYLKMLFKIQLVMLRLPSAKIAPIGGNLSVRRLSKGQLSL